MTTRHNPSSPNKQMIEVITTFASIFTEYDLNYHDIPPLINDYYKNLSNRLRFTPEKAGIYRKLIDDIAEAIKDLRIINNGESDVNEWLLRQTLETFSKELKIQDFHVQKRKTALNGSYALRILNSMSS